MHIIEIDWATDDEGFDIVGPVGPFDTSDAANDWAYRNIRNGEWNLCKLSSPGATPEKGESNGELR